MSFLPSNQSALIQLSSLSYAKICRWQWLQVKTYNYKLLCTIFYNVSLKLIFWIVWKLTNFRFDELLLHFFFLWSIVGVLCWIWTCGCRIECAEGYTELWHPLIQVTIIIAETGHRWRGVQDPLLRLICRWNKSHHLAPPSSICDEVDSCSTISALQIGLQQHITLKYVCRQSLIWKLSIGGMLWGGIR